MKNAIMLTLLILTASWVWGQDQPKIATPAYWSAVAATSALTAWDAQTALAGYARDPYCYESATPWLYGRRPGAAREYSFIAGEVVVSATASYLLKRHHQRWWLAPLAWTAGVHAYGIVNNLGVCPWTPSTGSKP
jgi:hypothetical protein